MDDIVVITLFRHGLTEGNQRKAYMGWNDSPLSAEGKRALSRYQLQKDNYDYFLSSDLDRCVLTMNLLFPDVTPETAFEWREMNFGSFQGKTYEELKENREYRAWLDHFSTISPPGGESFGEFSARVQKGWSALVEQILLHHKKSPFIVTHGGVIRYLLTEFAPEKKPFWDWKIAHGSGYEFVFDLQQLRRKNRCTLLREVPLTGREPG